MHKVSILIPCYNEEQSLPLLRERLNAVLEGLPQYQWEVMLVNDGSTDGTLELMRQLHEQSTKQVQYCYIDLSRNFGKENALLAGFDHVSGDCLIIMDADLQHPPEVIPQMLQHWEEGYEDVYARRRSRGKESWLRRRLSLLFYKILQHSSRYDVLENVGDFRLLDRCCINALRQLRENDRYTKGMFSWIGFRKKEITFDQGDRTTGQSSMSYRRLISLAIEGIVSFTTTPLRISTIAGFIISMVAFIYMIYVFIKAALYGDSAQGFPTLAILILFLGGIQLISLGIIGEYLSRVFNETKRRPPYIAREINGKKL